MKTAGHRTTLPASPADALRRAERLIAAANKLTSRKRARGFVFKAKTHKLYEEWKRAQENPRFW